ncbi:MAG: hypothetical protein Q7J12_00115 [Syntrophales bacterium]|uniref:hypothetical protein n=1 Tax=Candidatus Wunengus sp. YC61 TaxID=3367698 RepID=UPI002715DD89|nr:hypothetical protein [Syntrophales bacterium]
MTEKQRELADKHGTPEQFEKAIWEAYADLFITAPEAWEAIMAYQNEWALANYCLAANAVISGRPMPVNEKRRA